MEYKDIFELWKEYEGIAMHFNELLIQVRYWALTTLTAILTGIIAALVKFSSEQTQRMKIMFFASLVLLSSWIAVATLDHQYYSRLLTGTVKEIVALEKMSMVEITAGDQKEKIQLINLSTAIDDEVNSGAFDEGNADTWNSGIWYFYLIGGTPIIAALLVSALSLLFSSLKREN